MSIFRGTDQSLTGFDEKELADLFATDVRRCYQTGRCPHCPRRKTALFYNGTPPAPPVYAFEYIEAESYDSESGTRNQDNENGQHVAYIENGDYIAFGNVDFGAGAKSFTATLTGNPSQIEIHTDSLESEYCQLGGEVKASQLYAVYCKWVDENNEYKMPCRKFGLEMSKRYTKKMLHGCVHYCGLSLNISGQ